MRFPVVVSSLMLAVVMASGFSLTPSVASVHTGISNPSAIPACPPRGCG